MSNTEIAEKLLSSLYPIYEDLLNKENLGDICVFCIQWGNNFPSPENKGILYVGKAVNGWITNEKNAKLLFDLSNKDRIFQRSDQIEWVKNLRGTNDIYNTNKSAFWRVISKISESTYSNNWYSDVAWSNLYKLAPWEGGNPNASLRRIQEDHCKNILAKEIEVLSPKFVIMLTSGWEREFLKHMNDGKDIKHKEVVNWGNYTSNLYHINNVYYITTQHPQGKKETPHAKAISGFIDKYK